MKLFELDFKNHIKDTIAYESLQKLKLPNKKTEEFKKFNLNDIFTTQYKLNDSTSITLDKYKYLISDKFYTIFLLNSQIKESHTFVNENIQYSQNKKKCTTSNNALYHLGETFLEYENNINISKNLDKPLLLINLCAANNSFIPSSLNFSLEKNCTADILELFISENHQECFLNVNRAFNLSKSAILNYTKQEKFLENDSVFFNFNSDLEQKSTLNIVSIDSNAKKSLNSWDFILNNENISLSINAITNINKRKSSANIANIIHNGKNITSIVNVRHILKEYSSAVFDVKSTINKKAINANILQSSQTTLLSDDAQINAQPRLLIHTDELEAKHSATCGAINEEELYYLTSRGISKNKALNMIIESLETQTINKIQNTILKDFVLKIKGKNNV